MKQKPEMEVKPTSTSAAESASGSEDILDALALRIDQLAASDSEDDVFSGMFTFQMTRKCMTSLFWAFS